ncbi:hypothetical protein CO665_27520 [Rhizobium anhuiense]|uniref:DUF3800 domain-containing protein n=1 Tax=Rhizobium anhuiense TaxID=1184720 RepID=UPI000BE8104B|nr:DUF3800 domain-containing protein [Rhizobium anhuiense]PDS35102.1 hypothetical protein CO665_27520 [Rhizobium anhuiense]
MTPTTALAEPQAIWCDESGYTGGDLINREQPVFAYAAHDLSADESAALVDRIRTSRSRPIQAAELKAAGKTGLRKRDDWQEIAELVLDVTRNRFLTIVMDKRLALAGKTFEYIFEPVLADQSVLFYSNGLHRLVASAVHRTIKDFDGPAEGIAVELKQFMKSFDPTDAPNIFAATPALPEDALVLKEVLRFARGYRKLIDRESEHLRDSETGQWVLDLTSTALHSILAQGLGHRHRRVAVTCDESKPLLAMNEFFSIWIDRDEKLPINGENRMVMWRLNMARPITFGRSIDLPGLQIADLLAGITAEIYGPPDKNRLASLKPKLAPHLHENYILPDNDHPLDPDDPLARANLNVLRTLAARAELGHDALKGMEKVYKAAFKRFKAPAGRIDNSVRRLRRNAVA